MKKTLLLLSVILITAVILNACANKPEQRPEKVDTTTALQEVQPTTKEEISTENITAQPATEKTTVTEPVITEPKTNSDIQHNKSEKPTEEAKTNANTVDNIITKEKAKSIALKHAGLKETDIKRLEIELDKERKYFVYELDFDADKYEYEYEVNAQDGKVIKAEKEIKD